MQAPPGISPFIIQLEEDEYSSNVMSSVLSFQLSAASLMALCQPEGTEERI